MDEGEASPAAPTTRTTSTATPRFVCTLVPAVASTTSSSPSTLREDLPLTSVQQDVYRVVRQLLEGNAEDRLGLVASLVSLDMTELSSLGMEEDEEMVVSIITPRKGHHELYRRLELLTNQENNNNNNSSSSSQPLPRSPPRTQQQQETGNSNNGSNNPILPALIYELTGRQSSDPRDIENIAKRIPRRVCQHPFRKNDIVWVCRTCQADETCVLCHACFSSSDHENHDVAFYHAQAGGCCDCGDPDGTFLMVFYRLIIIISHTPIHSKISLGSGRFLSPARAQCRVRSTR
jgi:Putative zinc finger in N-recognin (UBR box)